MNLEKTASNNKANYFNNNFNNCKKGTFFRNLAAYGCKIRKKSPVTKHFAGALVSKIYGAYGKEKQKEKAKIWGVGDSYFTKWDTTLWYGISLTFEHIPLIKGSLMLESSIGFTPPLTASVGNFIGATALNTYRAISAFCFNKPFPSITVWNIPIWGYCYGKDVKNWSKEKMKSLKNILNKI